MQLLLVVISVTVVNDADVCCGGRGEGLLAAVLT